jgi:hypothetical protein
MSSGTKFGPGAPHLAGLSDPATLARLQSEWRSLQERLGVLDHRLRDCADRQRFASDPDAVAEAAREEQRYLDELDRLMTRARAIEGQLLARRRRLH